MTKQEEIRGKRIERVRKTLLSLALDNPRASYTLKELAEVTGIPNSSVRSIVEHPDCWMHITWTTKQVPVIERNYRTVKGHRQYDSIMADRIVLVNEIKRLMECE